MEEGLDVQLEVAGTGRRRLLTAATKLFVKVGISEVTVAQILETSGVKAPTLYHHFGGKEGLYVTWVSSTLDILDAEFRMISAKGLPLREFLIEAARIMLGQRSLDVLQVMRDRKWLADPDSVECVDNALDYSVFRPIAKGIETATRSNDAMAEAQMFVHLVGVRRSGYQRHGITEPASYEQIVDLFLSGIEGSSSREDERDDQTKERVGYTSVK